MTMEWRSRAAELVREAGNDPRSTYDLISLALSEVDEDTAWDHITFLHRRGTREIFHAARGLIQSACTLERTLGVNILGQLGIPDRSFPRESIELLLELLQAESDEAVLQAVCIAMGHIHDPLAIPALARLSHHPSEYVRYSVVHGLAGQSDPLALATLIQLTEDHDDDVRDWATFGLGTLVDDDTPAIRDALLRRTADAYSIVRGEALLGLARRHDERVIEPLLHELTHWEPIDRCDLPIEAAEEHPDERLLPILLRLKQTMGDEDHRFDLAIERCSRVMTYMKE